MIDWEKELNNEQLEVVKHGEGPCLVLAGAGSGKTRVITYRVAYLLEQGIKPENILLVTFTNKAAAEMLKRVQHLTGSDQRLPWAGTFHHIAYKILRQYAPVLNYANNFSILDSDDSEALLKLCAKEFKSDGEGKKFPSAAVISSIISYARNAELAIEEVLDARYPQWQIFAEQIKNIASAYALKKQEAQAMDFDDLLVNLLRLLQLPHLTEKFGEQFKYILVDEYQDTNKIQASVIKILAQHHGNILVVGDDAQSIYSFRAADIENILRFERDWPEAKIFKLETNYRSSEQILKVANDVIANNLRQYQKELRTSIKNGKKPILQPQADAAAEAQYIVGRIEKLLKEGTEEKEIAVLFRAAHHSQRLEMELVKAGLSYDYRGGLRFFERAHVKDVLAYLRLMNNLADTAAWLRVLLHEEGIGPSSANNLLLAIREAKDTGEIKDLGYQILGERAKNGWTNFMRIWEALLDKAKKPAELMEAVLESPYIEFLEAEYVDAAERLQDLEQLKNFAASYADLEEFLAEASLQESFSLRGDGAAPKNSGKKIVLSTIHQAKGLEWSAVFIMNVGAGAFPNERALREANGIEEERRLFYVALTRAKKHLFLTYPLSGGGFGDTLSGPSMFLEEIDMKLLEDHSLLMGPRTILDDEEADVHYVEEEPSIKIRPGSFLRDIDDL